MFMQYTNDETGQDRMVWVEDNNEAEEAVLFGIRHRYMGHDEEGLVYYEEGWEEAVDIFVENWVRHTDHSWRVWADDLSQDVPF